MRFVKQIYIKDVNSLVSKMYVLTLNIINKGQLVWTAARKAKKPRV